MLTTTSAYCFGFECGHLNASEAQEELCKMGVVDEAAYNAFWSGYSAFQDDAYDDEDYDDYDDGQPSEYDEWQDYFGGDDWDHGQYDEY